MAALNPGSPQYDHYLNFAEQVGQQHHFPPGLMGSIINQESSFNPQAVSNKGAIGLMQIMPGNGNPFGYTRSQLENPDFNIQAGANILDYYAQKYGGGNVYKGLEYYNAGPGTMAKNGGTPPSSTQQYVDSIKNHEPRYAQYGSGDTTPSSSDQPSASNPINYWLLNRDGTFSPGFGQAPNTTPLGADPNGVAVYPGGTGRRGANDVVTGFQQQPDGTYSAVINGNGTPVYDNSLVRATPDHPLTFWYQNTDNTLQPGFGPPPNTSPVGLDPNGIPVFPGGTGSRTEGNSITGFKKAPDGSYMPVVDGSGTPHLQPAPFDFAHYNFSPANNPTTGTPFNGASIFGQYGFTPTNGQPSLTPAIDYGQRLPSLIPTALPVNSSNSSSPGGPLGFGYDNNTGTWLANPFTGTNNTPGNGPSPANAGLNPLFSGTPFTGNSGYGNTDPFANLLGNFFGSNGNDFMPAGQAPNNGAGSYGPNNTGSGSPFGLNSLLSNIFGGNNGSPTNSGPGNSSMPVIHFPGLSGYGSYGSPDSTGNSGANNPGNSNTGNPFDINSLLPNLFGSSNAGNSALPTIQFPGLNGTGSYGSPAPSGNQGANNPGSGNPFDLNSLLPNIFGSNNGSLINSATTPASMPVIHFPGLSGYGNYGTPGTTGNYGTNSPGNPSAGNPFNINSLLPNLFGNNNAFGNNNSGNSSLPTIQFPGLNNSGGYGTPGTSNNNGSNNSASSNPFDINSMLSNLFSNSSTPGTSSMPTIQFPGLNNAGSSYGAPAPSGNDGTSSPGNTSTGNPFDINSMLSGLFGNNSGNPSLPTIQFPGLNNSGSNGSLSPSGNDGATTGPSNPNTGNPFDINSMLPGLFGNNNSGNSSLPTIQFPGLNNGGSYSGSAPSSNPSSPSTGNPFDINSMLSNMFGGSNSGNSSLPTIQFPGLNNSGSYGSPAPSGNNGATNNVSSPSSPNTSNPFDINSMLSNMFGGSNSGNSSMPTIQFPGLNSGGSSSPSNNNGAATLNNAMPVIQFPGLETSGSSPTSMGSTAPADNSTSMPTITFPGLNPSTAAPPVDTAQSAPPVDTSQAMPPVDTAQSAPPMDTAQSAPPMDPGAFNFGMGGMGGSGGAGTGPADRLPPSRWQFMEAGLDFHLAGNDTGAADHLLPDARQEVQMPIAGAGQRAHSMPGQEQALAHLHG